MSKIKYPNRIVLRCRECKGKLEIIDHKDYIVSHKEGTEVVYKYYYECLKCGRCFEICLTDDCIRRIESTKLKKLK
jgi:NAD-dependent dihydropyrimidine dehydrogenase PreA subunit